MFKRVCSVFLALVLTLSLAGPGLASGESGEDPGEGSEIISTEDPSELPEDLDLTDELIASDEELGDEPGMILTAEADDPEPSEPADTDEPADDEPLFTPKPTEEGEYVPAEHSCGLKVGDFVYFGGRETRLPWQVVDIDGDQAVLYATFQFFGPYDASIHGYTIVRSLMRYDTYGSVTWEYSDLRKWLNSSSDTVGYGDVVFDYECGGIASLDWDTGDEIAKPDYGDWGGFMTLFSDEERALLKDVTHASLIPYPESGKPGIMDTRFGQFGDEIYDFYTAGTVSWTTDKVFLLNAIELKEYVLDRGLCAYEAPDGHDISVGWLRDSAETNFAGFYYYIGTHALTAGIGGASSNQGDLTDGIRPACCIDLSDIASLGGWGTIDDPYVLNGDPPEDPVDPGFDGWGFINSDAVFGPRSEGYDIQANDYNRLFSFIVSPVDLIVLTWGIENNKWMHNYHVHAAIGPLSGYITWNGSCYGMSAISILVHDKILSTADFGSSAGSLSAVPFSDKVESAINYYFFQQKLSPVANEKDSFMRLSQSAQLNKLRNLADACQAGRGSPVLVGFQGFCSVDSNGKPYDSIGHAVVAYGAADLPRAKEFTINGVSDTYNHVIYIYDCSVSARDGRQHLYYNDSGRWCMPAWNLISSTSRSMNSEGDWAQLQLATADTDIINTVDYRTGLSGRATENIKHFLYTNSSASYRLSWESGSVSVDGALIDGASDSDLNIILNPNVTADGERNETTAIVVLPDAAAYTVEAGADSLGFMLRMDETASSACAETSGTAVFSEEGVRVALDDTGDCSLSVTSENEFGEKAWHTMEVFCTDTNDLSLAFVDDGVLLEGSDLGSVTAVGIHDDESVSFGFSTDESSVLLSEKDGNLVALTDTDHDGEFETVIGSAQLDAALLLQDIVNGDTDKTPADAAAILKALG